MALVFVIVVFVCRLYCESDAPVHCSGFASGISYLFVNLSLRSHETSGIWQLNLTWAHEFVFVLFGMIWSPYAMKWLASLCSLTCLFP